jgi:hypothetical protein
VLRKKVFGGGFRFLVELSSHNSISKR